MTKSKTIQVRVSPQVKDDADRVLGRVGLSMSEAINVFLHQVILRQGIPFPVADPELRNGASSACPPASSTIDHARKIAEIALLVGGVCSSYGVDKLVLFGSQARGEANSESDFDFRVDRGEVRGMEFFSLKHDLEQALHARVDLITTESMRKEFAEAIRGEEVVLYDRSRTQPAGA